MRNSLAGKLKYINDNLGNAKKIMGVSIDDTNAGANRVLKLNLNKIEYQEDLTGEGIGYANTTWTDLTRPTNPTENVRGYNTDKKRIEFYILAEDKWYYKWQGQMDATPIESPPALFSGNFKVGWFTDNSPFTLKIADDFINEWFINNVFNQLFVEDLSTWISGVPYTPLFEETLENWLTGINYTQLKADCFGEPDWFIDNVFIQKFNEDFENIDWE